MKVKQLKELLTDVDDEKIIVMASDPEGNSFSPLADFSIGTYKPENSYSGEFDGESNEKNNAICLWSIN